MIVITLTDCPPKVRGDLSKWLVEINTGVYVGNLSARVRDALWERICENLSDGRATMVYSARNEQRLEFKTYNGTWKPIDFDGIVLMKHPFPQKVNSESPLPTGFSKAAKFRYSDTKKSVPESLKNYAVIDIETTGLNVKSDSIIEIAAIIIQNGVQTQTMSLLIKQPGKIPSSIETLTGITDAMIEKDGLSEKEVLEQFVELIGNLTIVGYNLAFDMSFINVACRRCNVKFPTNKCVDVMISAKRKLGIEKGSKLKDVAKKLAIQSEQFHRALPDCIVTNEVFQKLNEL